MHLRRDCLLRCLPHEGGQLSKLYYWLNAAALIFNEGATEFIVPTHEMLASIRLCGKTQNSKLT